MKGKRKKKGRQCEEAGSQFRGIDGIKTGLGGKAGWLFWI